MTIKLSEINENILCHSGQWFYSEERKKKKKNEDRINLNKVVETKPKKSKRNVFDTAMKQKDETLKETIKAPSHNDNKMDRKGGKSNGECLCI